MNHSRAHLIDFKKESAPAKVIKNSFMHEEVEQALNKSEQLMHNKRQQQRSFYYKKLGNALSPSYQEVLLFARADAKTKLYNILHSSFYFNKIKIEVQSAGKITEDQKQAFVKNHF